jgi:hypothetical protein
MSFFLSTRVNGAISREGMRFFLFIILVALLLPTGLLSRDYYPHGPFALRSQNPLYLLFLQPRPERAAVLGPTDLRLSLRGPYSNIYERGTSATSGVDFTLDMELFRPNLMLEYGLNSGWELGLEIPFLHFEGGFLDAFVQGFHNAFGFPNGGRDKVANGQFTYDVSQSGTNLYRVNPDTFGVSDFVFHAKKLFFDERALTPALAGTLSFKIPTGDRGEGLGSGMPDIGVNLSAEKHYKRFHSYANLGAVALGASSLGFEPFKNDFVWHWMAAVELSAWDPHLGIIAQIQGDSSLFHDSGIATLDGRTVILTIGLAGQVGDWAWKLGFAEDVTAVGPAVDFTSFLEISYHFSVLGDLR